MVSPFFRAAIGFGCCLILRAQPPAPPAGGIAGLVLDGGTGQAIRRAIVTLSTSETRPRDAIAWTDATGRFAFGYLLAGRYELRVAKAGYQTAAYGAASPRRPPGIISLAAGETRNDIVLRLQVVSSITGIVTDEDGDALPNVQIAAFRPVWQRGKRRLIQGATTGSDSNGHYRLAGLASGSYVLEASLPFGNSSRKRSEVSAGETPGQDSYLPQFYPGTDRAESARPLAVEAGQEYADIDFRLRTQPDTALQGKIVLPPGLAADPPPAINVTALPRGLGIQARRGAAVLPDLTFRFAALPPGSYLVTAFAAVEGRSYRGVQEIEAGSGAIRDLTVALEPGIDLSGTVTADGPDAARNLPASVTLVPGDDIPWNGQPLRGAVAKDGAFTIAGVPAGIWDINTGGPRAQGVYLKSMRLGDQDVLTEEMEIRSSTHAALTIVLGSPAARVQGDVAKSGQAVRPIVLLAPEPRFRHVASLYRSVNTDADGHFAIDNLAPGVYQLFAFDEFDRQSIEDPEFLKPFEAEGVTVTLREGENPPQKLSTVFSANPQTTREPGEPQ